MIVRYLFSMPDGNKIAAGDILDKPLHSQDGENGCLLRFRDYFSMVSKFFQSRKKVLLSLSNETSVGIGQDDFKHLDIISERTGNFYQIARCVFRGGRDNLEFCASTSRRRKRLLLQDFSNLCRLYRDHGLTFLPKPYLTGTIARDNGENARCKIGIAVNEWLDGYWEWHLTDDSHAEAWIPGQGRIPINRGQLSVLFYNMARNIALSFNPGNCSHIWLWSNCAGDFVLSLPEKVDAPVKLTTVRYYGNPWPLLPASGNRQAMLAALLYFFLDVCMVIRIDRISGTGRYLFACQDLLACAVKGFLSGINKILDDRGSEIPGPREFLLFIQEMQPDEFRVVYDHIISVHIDLLRDDAPFMKGHVKQQARELSQVIGDLHLPIT